MRLIDADALMQEFAEFVRDSNNSDFADVPTWNDAVSLLGSAPTIEERKCGKWNAYYHGINETPSFTYSCNQCGYSAPYGLYGGKYSQKKWNFCPNCGADMKGEQDDESKSNSNAQTDTRARGMGATDKSSGI